MSALVDLRPLYEEFVQLSNQGARDYGFADTSQLWLSGYDAPPAEVVDKAERVWLQFKPLYEQLHWYTMPLASSFFYMTVINLISIVMFVPSYYPIMALIKCLMVVYCRPI
jgi:hypothetical protein